MNPNTRGYVGLSFRHVDQYNNYEFRMRMSQNRNLTANISMIYVTYQSVSGTAAPLVGSPNCFAHLQYNPGACMVDTNPNTWLTMQYGYKPHVILDLYGWYQITYIVVTNGQHDTTHTLAQGHERKQHEQQIGALSPPSFPFSHLSFCCVSCRIVCV